jgi:hypothetical protein
MTDPDLRDLAELDLDPARVERIRRRGQRALDAPAGGPWVRAEAGLVALFSLATLAWAAAAVLQVG